MSGEHLERARAESARARRWRTAGRDAEMARALAGGIPLAEIARAYGLSRTGARLAIQRVGCADCGQPRAAHAAGACASFRLPEGAE